jgi:hypothetical protein
MALANLDWPTFSTLIRFNVNVISAANSGLVAYQEAIQVILDEHVSQSSTEFAYFV